MPTTNEWITHGVAWGTIATGTLFLFLNRNRSVTGIGHTAVFPLSEHTGDEVESWANECILRQVADQILARAGLSQASPPIDKATALHRFVADEVPYVDDPPGHEKVTSPGELAMRVLQNPEEGEDCDGLAILMAALAKVSGIPASISLVDTDGDGELDHAIAVLLIDGRPVYAETTMEGVALGWHPPTNVTEALLIQ
jgi:transglutaminase-like putative cysteine protease